jgi:nicotinamidase-related amidase
VYYWKETSEVDIKKSLIKIDDCVLVIIDVQDHFLAKLPPERAKRLVNRVGWLMEVAKILNVPVIVTVEERELHGGLNAVLSEKLPSGTKVLDKAVFNLVGQANILDVIRRTGRETAVLVGLETDVCVAQSAIGLLQNGFQVVVLADVADSPGDGHVFGLERMREAGVLVMSLKGLYYEWVRTVSMCKKLVDEHLKRIGYPDGILL